MLLGLVLAACGRCGAAETTKDAAAEARPAEIDGASVEAAAPPDAAAPPRDASPEAAVVDPPASDAGPSACRLAYGPAEQPFRGPATLVVAGSELKLVANDNGKPRVFLLPIGPPPAAALPRVAPPVPDSFASMRWPTCEVAGTWVYCQAAGGLVYRTTLGGHDTKAIAKSRPNTRIAAAALGPDHAVLATLDVRRTTEGDRLQAFVTMDEGETTRLSEEGSGATVVRLAPRGAGAVALYLDSRTSMVPVHARPLSLRGAELALGDDAVVSPKPQNPLS